MIERRKSQMNKFVKTVRSLMKGKGAKCVTAMLLALAMTVTAIPVGALAAESATLQEAVENEASEKEAAENEVAGKTAAAEETLLNEASEKEADLDEAAPDEDPEEIPEEMPEEAAEETVEELLDSATPEELFEEIPEETQDGSGEEKLGHSQFMVPIENLPSYAVIVPRTNLVADGDFYFVDDLTGNSFSFEIRVTDIYNYHDKLKRPQVEIRSREGGETPAFHVDTSSWCETPAPKPGESAREQSIVTVSWETGVATDEDAIVFNFEESLLTHNFEFAFPQMDRGPALSSFEYRKYGEQVWQAVPNENIASGFEKDEQIEFRFQLREGFCLDDIRWGENKITANEGVYTATMGTESQTITLAVSYRIPVTVSCGADELEDSGITLLWGTEGSEPPERETQDGGIVLESLSGLTGIYFTIAEDVNYPITSVCYLDENGTSHKIDPEEGLYAYRGDFYDEEYAVMKIREIVILTEPRLIEIPVECENATVKWGNTPDTIENDLVDGKIETMFSDVYFTVTPGAGYSISAVTRTDADDQVSRIAKKNQAYKLPKEAVSDANGSLLTKKISVETGSSVELVVTYNSSLIATPSVWADGAYVDPDDVYNGMVKFAFPESQKGKKVTIQALPLENCRLSGVMVDGRSQPAALKNGTVTVTLTQKTAVSYAAAGIPMLKIGSIFYQDNAALSLRPGDAPELKVFVGPEEAAVSMVNCKIGTAEAADFARNESGRWVLNTSSAKGSTVKITVTGTDFGSLSATVSVLDPAGKELLGGKDFKYDQTQDAYVSKKEVIRGNGVEYALTLQKKDVLDESGLKAVVTSGAGDAEIYAGEDPFDGLLFLWVVPSASADSDMKVQIVDQNDDEIRYGKPFVIRTKAMPQTAPAVKVLSATDLGMTLSLAANKEIRDNIYTYYLIEAAATQALPDGDALQDSVVARVKTSSVTDGKWYLNLAKDGKKPGEGHEASYDIKVSVVQLKDLPAEPDQSTAGDFAGGNIAGQSAVKELKNQKTKTAFFENKLTLTKKASYVTIGDEGQDPRGVLLAVAKFSAKTTLAKIKNAYLMSPKGSVLTTANPKISIGEDGASVYLNEWNACDFYPGEYSLFVQADFVTGTATNTGSNQYTGSIATMPVVFKPAVTGIQATAPSRILYKAENKPATISLSAQPESVYRNPYTGANVSFKPGNSKVAWTLTEAGSEELAKAISIKNGKVTVAKNYILSTDEEENTFKVQAVACDVKSEPCKSNEITITLSAKPQAPAKVFIGTVEGADKPARSDGHVSTDLEGKLFAITDETGTKVDPSNCSITVTPKAGLTIASFDPYPVHVTKPGTYTVKVTANDGSKKTLTRKFVVKSDTWNGYQQKFYQIHNVELDAIAEDSFVNGVMEMDGVPMQIIADIRPSLNGEPVAGICDNRINVKIKGAKLVDISNFVPPEDIDISHYAVSLKPTAKEVSVEISDKDKLLDKKTYRFKLGGFDTLKPAAKKFEIEKDAYEGATLRFDLSKDFVEEDGVEYNVGFFSDEIISRNTSPQIMTALVRGTTSAIERDKNGKAKGIVVTVLPTEELKKLVNGTHTVDAYLTRTKESKTAIVSLMTPVSIVVKEAPKPECELSAKVKITREAGSKKAIPFKKFKNATLLKISGLSPMIYNTVDADGKVSNARDYLEVREEDGGIILQVKDGVTIPQDVKTMTVRIGYLACGRDLDPNSSSPDTRTKSLWKYDPVTITIE